MRIWRGETMRLEAELAGEPIDPERHELGAEVKASTARGLRGAPVAAGEGRDSGCEVIVALDV